MNNDEAKSIIKLVDKYIRKYGIPKYVENMKNPIVLAASWREYCFKKYGNKLCTYNDLYNYLNKLVRSYHHHSFVYIKSLEDKSNKNLNEVKIERPINRSSQPLPKFKWDSEYKIGTIIYYHFYLSNNQRQNEKDASQIVNMVKKEINKWKNNNLSALIIDLRKHYGGDMRPAINSLSEILGKTTLFGWNNKMVRYKDKKWVNYNNGSFGSITFNQKFLTNKLAFKKPIAVLVSNKTCSSGEIIASIFSGRSNAKIFGEETCGKLSGNTIIMINNDIDLILTISLITTVDEEFIDDEFVIIDKFTNRPIFDAKQWIKNCKELEV